MKRYISVFMLSILMMGTVSTMSANAESTEYSPSLTIMLAQTWAFSILRPYSISERFVSRTSPLREQSSKFFDFEY